MRLTHALIALLLAVILGVPFVMRPAAERGPRPTREQTLVIVTPHVQQIRDEFALAFSQWHQRTYGEPAFIDFRTPGGTSEILKQLSAQYTAAIRDGRIAPDGSCPPGTMSFDLMFGGGSFDHGRLKRNDEVFAVVERDGTTQRIPISISVPAGFTQEQLDAWFGPNRIGSQFLYDPEQYWIGTALSSFGLVYNRDLFRALDLPDPTTFEDLTHPRLVGNLVLADPRQSGSITTTFDSILSNFGWDRGWRILREMAANSRAFTNSATKPPIDVSAGEAAAALAIDFYGRGQAQAVLRPGDDPASSRVGYADPAGAVYIDADPVSLLRGGPNPVLARRFIEFCLTEEAQALWQFRSQRDPKGKDNPRGASGEPMGPRRHELRRMPVRRVMYEKYADAMIDRTDPFVLASDTRPAGWRSAIGPMMGAFSIDIADEQRSAWRALIAARTNPSFPKDALARMEAAFYAWPTTTIDAPTLHPSFSTLSDAAKAALRDPQNRIRTFVDLRQSLARGVLSLDEPDLVALRQLAAAQPPTLEFTAENFRAIREYWRLPGVMGRVEIAYTQFFRDQYALVRQLARQHAPRERP